MIPSGFPTTSPSRMPQAIRLVSNSRQAPPEKVTPALASANKGNTRNETQSFNGILISCRGGPWTEPPRGQELSVGDSCRGAVQLGKADGEPLVVALGLVLKNADA